MKNKKNKDIFKIIIHEEQEEQGYIQDSNPWRTRRTRDIFKILIHEEQEEQEIYSRL